MVTLHDILDSHRTGRPIVMGILNVTPDSFSDAGQFFDATRAVEHAHAMLEQGADIIDIGAESTRPGSDRVGADEQIRRLSAVIPQVTARGALVSIDTTWAQVAQMAVEAGAQIINDISGGREDNRLLALAARHHCGFVLMHMLGEPASMQADPQYHDVVAQVKEFLAQRLSAARQAGLADKYCILDPGIGFGKTTAHNLTLLAHMAELAELGRPILIGASRKRFIGQVSGAAEPAQRVAGSVAAALETYRQGATIFRVHDVGPTVQALAIARAIRQAAARG